MPLALPLPGSALWFDIRPNLKRSAVIAGDILSALGKRRDVAGKGRNENQDIALVLAWLHAYEITDLVAIDAQNLTRLTLRQLVSLAKAAGVHLWLLHRPPRSDEFFTMLERVRAHPMRYRDLPQPQPRQTLTGTRLSLGIDQSPWPPFHSFRSSLRAELPSGAYDSLTAHFDEEFNHYDEVLDRDGSTPEVIATLVERAMSPAPLDDSLVTSIRALQLASWHHDMYLKTDIPALLASSERAVIDPVTIDETLVGYRQPHRAIVVALAAQQIGVTATLALTLVDAANGFPLISDARPIRLHEHTQRACRAQLELRRRQGAQGNDPLFLLTDRAVSSALNEAALDFGIAVHGRRAERYVHPRRWLARLGITLTALT